MPEPMITDEYLASLNPPDLSKLPRPDRDETVMVPAILFAELVGIAQENFDTPDDMDERQAKIMEAACLTLGAHAPITWRWFTARQAALFAWVRSL
jgi:hypothetical protein